MINLLQVGYSRNHHEIIRTEFTPTELTIITIISVLTILILAAVVHFAIKYFRK